MLKPVALTIRCLHCGATLRLDVVDWTPDVYAERTPQDYVCPECHTIQTVRLTGQLVRVRSKAGDVADT